MSSLIEWIRAQLESNDILAGMVGGSIAVSVMYLLKGLPLQLLKGLKWLFLRYLTVEVTITNADLGPFLLVANWLNEVVGEKWNRVQLDFGLTCTSGRGESDDLKLRRVLTLGYGSFGFWYKGRYVRVSRTRDQESKSEGRRKPETLTLRFFTRDRSIIQDILSASQEESPPMQYSSQCWGSWAESSVLVRRDLDTVILPPSQKQRILDDLTWFYSNQDIFRHIGTACTRGYLFHGPPGTGKTTLARALASHFQKDLYVVTLGDLTRDGQLLDLMQEVSAGAFVVFEDVDVCGVATSRTKQDASNNSGILTTHHQDKGVTLAGLLQALDGVNAGAEHVVIFTTNKPEVLDPALTRYGRIDIHEEIGPLSRVHARQMAKQFFDDSYISLFDSVEFPLPGAEVQNILLEEHKARHTHAQKS